MVKQRFIIIDGNALLHRAFHALPPLATKQGILVNAVYGFTTVLMKAIKDLKPVYGAVTFDVAGGTFRDDLYKEYKAGRTKQPDELYSQIPMIKQVVKGFDIQVVEKKGFEADDVIATLARNAQGKETMIVTGDKDTFQLINQDIKVYTFKKGMSDILIYDEQEVKNRYGLSPEQMIDFKALAGDPSDNIPGVKGIGEKTAIDLLQKFGTLENLYKNIDSHEIKPRVQGLLREYKKDAILGKELVTLVDNVPVDTDIEKYKIGNPNYDKLKELFASFEFKGLVKRIDEMNPVVKKDQPQSLFAKKMDKIPKYAHDIKALMHELRVEELPEDSFDTKIAAYLLTVGDRDHNLESLANQYGIKDKNQEEVIDKLIPKLTHDLEKEKMWGLFKNIEMPLIQVLYKMEQAGIKLDTNYLKNLSLEFNKELKQLTKKIYGYAQQEFNINSPIQLREILFEKLNLIPEIGRIKKTAKGSGRSTAASELEKLRGAHPIVDLIFEYRELSKLESTYTHALIDLVQDGRVHTTFNQTITTTGRLSSSAPNLQNIPIRTEIGRQIRKAFIAEKGHTLISADYSQIELRAAASLSGDPKMLEAFRSGHDFHRATASQIFNIPLGKVTSDQRRKAKAINFGIIYGMGANALAQSTGISRNEAQEFIAKYFEVFDVLADYLEDLKDFARDNGYVETLFGRRRYIPDINSGVQQVRAAAERMAVNMPFQGTAADLMKMAMIEVDNKLVNENVKMLLQVHDELVLEVKNNLVDKVSRELKFLMENVYKLKVPVEVEVKTGDNWGEMEIKTI